MDAQGRVFDFPGGAAPAPNNAFGAYGSAVTQAIGEAAGMPGSAVVIGREMIASPERLPTFPALATGIDAWMTRLPWWVVAGATAGFTWWLCRRSYRKAKSEN